MRNITFTTMFGSLSRQWALARDTVDLLHCFPRTRNMLMKVTPILPPCLV